MLETIWECGVEYRLPRYFCIYLILTSKTLFYNRQNHLLGPIRRKLGKSVLVIENLHDKENL